MKHMIATCMCALIVTFIIAMSVQRHSKATARLTAAQATYSQTLNDVEEIIRLRSKQQVVNPGERPPQDVISLVNSTLASVGIPSNRLKSLTPEADTSLNAASSASAKYRCQSVRLTVENLSVEEIGSFLAQWRLSQQVWTPARIELNHVRKQDDNRYDISIVLSAIYVAES